MNHSARSMFCVMIRELRTSKGLKQREVADAIGVREGTYANAESSPWKCMRRSRAERLATYHELGKGERAALLAAWDNWPLSEGGKRRADYWARRNQARTKIRKHDRLQLAVVELVGLLLIYAPDGAGLCNCEFGGGTVDDPTRPCEVCFALESVGIVDGWTTKERVTRQLAELQSKLETKGTTDD